MGRKVQSVKNKPSQYMRTMSNAVNLHVLSDLREVLRFWRDCSVEFCYWDTPGCNLGPKHRCWVNDGGCTNLHSTPGGAVTLLTKLLSVTIHHCLHQCAACPLPLGFCGHEGGGRGRRVRHVRICRGDLLTTRDVYCQDFSSILMLLISTDTYRYSYRYYV